MVPGPVRLRIDLHRGFAGVQDPDSFWVAVSSSADRMALAGGVVAIPGRTCTALLVALHAAAPGKSVKPRADLVRALSVLPVDVWRAAADVAQQVRATSAYILGLSQVDRGAELATALDVPHRITATQWISASHGSSTAYSLSRFASQPTVLAKARYLLLRLFPSRAAMRYSYPAAQRGRTGLMLAYLLRACRFVPRLPIGLRGLWAAMRQARRFSRD